MFLAIAEQPDGEFTLMIRRIESGDFVLMGQHHKQAWVHVSSRQGSFSASAESPRALLAQHAEELKVLLHPVLRYHGIDLSASTGGGLEIKNAVLKTGD